MMEHLDDFIKSKLAQDPIEFSEAHWMKAAKMIEEQELQKRKRFVIWFFFGQLMFMLALVLFISFESDGNLDALSLPQASTTSTSTSISTSTESVVDIPSERRESRGTTSIPQVAITKLQSVISPDNEKSLIILNGSLADFLSYKREASPNELRGFPDSSLTSTPQAANPNLQPISFKLQTITTTLPTITKYLDNKEENKLNIHPKIEHKHPAISIYAASSLYPYPQVGARRLIAYTAGINYTIHLKKRWNIETGIHYRVRQGSFSNLQTTTQDSFAFRRISTEYALKASQLHTIEMPLAIVYATSRHQAHLGVNYARLLGVKGELNKTTLQDGGNIQQVNKGWLEDDSFKTNRFELLLGYYFSIRPGFRLGAELHYMPGGMLNNTTSSNVYLESKLMFIDFGVRYDIR